MTAPKLTDTQRTILARSSDGEWRRGYELTNQAGPLSRLCRCGWLARSNSRNGFLSSEFAITPDGMAVLEATQ